MVLKSRQKPTKIVTSKTGVEVEKVYCRRCMEHKIPREFWAAVDIEVDSNGFMSVCSDCANILFDNLIMADDSIELATLKMCRKLNMKYDEGAIESAKKQIETVRESGKTIPSFLSIYKIKLVSTQSTKFSNRETEDLTYQEVTTINVSQDATTLQNLNEEEIDSEVVMFWGEGYGLKDYEWLEKKLADWKRTHKSDTEAEESLLREIVFKQFEIKKARETLKPVTSSMLKDLQDLMKTANVDPAKAALANAGRSNDTFSSFIRMIEDNRPAEYYQDKELFRDFDGLEKYFTKYVVRPLKNFVTQSRDFSLEDTDENEDDDLTIDTEIGENSESEV